MNEWNKNSWKYKKITQYPNYENEEEFNNVLKELSSKKALVSIKGINDLKKNLIDVVDGKSFLLQGGDCAESFSEFSPQLIKNYIKLLLQMNVMISYHSNKSVLKVGRIAGQFAKPRSNEFETKNGVVLPSYRGDMVNGFEFTPESRKFNPQRLLKAYFQSVETLEIIKSYLNRDILNIKNWRKNLQQFLEFLKDKGIKVSQDIVSEIDTMSKDDVKEVAELIDTNFYISHEGLHLDYEEAFTVYNKKDGLYYDTSAHMLWLGDRTRDINGAHVEYLSGIANPVGIKVSPNMGKEEIIKLLDKLDPSNTKGKIVLIFRLGEDKVDKYLPKFVDVLKREGKNIAYVTDPMHGNIVVKNGYKTRNFKSILSEVHKFYSLSKNLNFNFGGVHIEMTSDNVTECMGGLQDIQEDDLSLKYSTYCDPRLNINQSLELAYLISNMLKVKNY